MCCSVKTLSSIFFVIPRCGHTYVQVVILSPSLSLSLTQSHSLYCIHNFSLLLLVDVSWCQLPKASTLGWHNEPQMASDFNVRVVFHLPQYLHCLSLSVCMHFSFVAWSSHSLVVWRVAKGFWCHSINVWMLLPLMPSWYLQFCWCVPVNCWVASLSWADNVFVGDAEDFWSLGQFGSSFLCMQAVIVRTIFLMYYCSCQLR